MILKFVCLGSIISIVKNKTRARSDLLLNISLARSQSSKRVNHEREARMIYPLTTDRQTVIY